MTMVAKYLSQPNGQHINAAKQVIKYLKDTQDLSITFATKANSDLKAHIEFNTNLLITEISDSNWGPQDASKPKPNTNIHLDLFKSRSVSGFLIWWNPPPPPHPSIETQNISV